MAGDLHGIKRALKEKSPRTAHESTQMIAALCSDKKEETSAYFGLGRKFGGKATRRVTLPRTKKNKRSKLSKVNGYCKITQSSCQQRVLVMFTEAWDQQLQE